MGKRKQEPEPGAIEVAWADEVVPIGRGSRLRTGGNLTVRNELWADSLASGWGTEESTMCETLFRRL